jgi:predicted acyl esterase
MQQPTLPSAKAAFEQQPPVRVLFDNGAGNASHPGWPYPAFERSYTLDPAQPPTLFTILGTVRRQFHLGPNGTLADAAVPDPGADAFTWDSHARPPTDFTGDTGSGPNGLWTANPPYDWTQDPDGTAAAYVSPPLSEDTAVIGSGRVDLWVRSPVPNVDLQATISEVRPDGKETFVQGGWIRSKARALDDTKSNDVEAVPTLRQEDFADMPADQYVPVTIPLYYEGHMYRAGSRIRVRISAPGGDQPIWAFAEAEPAGQANIEIGYGGNMDSSLSLPVVPGPSAPTALPPCPSLRGEPCRDYVAFTNRAGQLPSGAGTEPGTGQGEQNGNQGSNQGPGDSTGGKKAKRCKKPKHAKNSAAAAKKKCAKKHRK